MMDINYFIEKFADQFEETDLSVFQSETIFKELDEWSSLVALGIIAMVDEEFEIEISGNEIRNATTIKDLFDIVSNKK